MTENELNQNPESEELSDTLAPSDDSFVLSDQKPNNPLSYVLFTVMLLGLAVGYFVFFHSGPKGAMASASAQQADKRINQFLSGGAKNLAAMDQLLKNTEREVKKMQTYPSARQVPVKDLKTNPFAYLPIEEKSNGENDRRQLEQQQAIARQAHDLKLQTIMYAGTHSQCLINNALYMQGQKIGALTVERISANSVIVGNGKVHFELKIQK